MKKPRDVSGLILLIVAFGVIHGCDLKQDQDVEQDEPVQGQSPAYMRLRIYSSPYASVDWAGDVRLKAQHHDHIATRSISRLVAYDNAGYDVVSLMDYSGNRKLSSALATRAWPPEDWVPSTILSQLTSIRVFLPNAEEVGVERHATSPFLTTYIEGAVPGVTKESWQYESLSEMFAVIRANGGFPCVAHPWHDEYVDLQGTFCAEIYTAYAEAQRLLGRDGYVTWDRNESLLRNWDQALQRSESIFGIAVNDHYGPYVTDETLSAVRDSGKIIVLAKAATAEEYRTAFERGAFFAIRDRGVVKDSYPQVLRIVVTEDSVTIDTDGAVRWITGGAVIAVGATLPYSSLLPNSRYLRAEIQGADDSTVYTQAFVVRPFGDVNADYSVDDEDAQICAIAEADLAPGDPVLLACRAAAQSPGD